MKALIFDSGTLINLSMNGLLYLLEPLKLKFDGKFLITSPVKRETLDRPLKSQRFQLGALRIQNLLHNKTIETPKALKIKDSQINSLTQKLTKIGNNLLETRGGPIEIVSEAEMSCLALSAILKTKGIQNLIAIDERTTRILSEKPDNLQEITSRKLHKPVRLKTTNFSAFKQFKFIRSSELVYVAHKLGLLQVKGRKALGAALFATKYKGSSISWDEIHILRKL